MLPQTHTPDSAEVRIAGSIVAFLGLVKLKIRPPYKPYLCHLGHYTCRAFLKAQVAYRELRVSGLGDPPQTNKAQESLSSPGQSAGGNFVASGFIVRSDPSLRIRTSQFQWY